MAWDRIRKFLFGEAPALPGNPQPVRWDIQSAIGRVSGGPEPLGANDREALQHAVRLIRLPYQCTRGHSFRITADALAKGATIRCPVCATVSILDRPTAVRLIADFEEMLAQVADRFRSSPRIQSELPAMDRPPANVDAIRLTISGKGRRAKFSGTASVPCECGSLNSVPLIGLSEDQAIQCQSCGSTFSISQKRFDAVREELEEELFSFLDELKLRDTDDEGEIVEFIMENGRFPKPRDMSPSGYPVPLAGESHYQEAIANCRAGERVALVLEPHNPHDAQAIAVLTTKGEKLGYIAKKSFVRRAVHDEGQGCRAKIWKINKGDDGLTGIVLDLELCDQPLESL